MSLLGQRARGGKHQAAALGRERDSIAVRGENRGKVRSKCRWQTSERALLAFMETL